MAVYRGSCFPTFNPHGYIPGQPPALFLRGQVPHSSRLATCLHTNPNQTILMAHEKSEK